MEVKNGVKDLHKLTVPERIQIYLLDYIGSEEKFELPEGLTLDGMAKGLRAKKGTLRTALKKMMDQNIVMLRETQIKGQEARQDAYLLTIKGISSARAVWNSISSQVVRVVETGGTSSDIPLSKLCFTLQFKRPTIHILNEICDNGEYRFGGEAECSKPKEDLESGVGVTNNQKIYSAALIRAWKDGKMTLDEIGMLEELQKVLDISKQTHSELEASIVTNVEDQFTDPPSSIKDIYKQTLRETLIHADKGSGPVILQKLREVLKISTDEHKMIQEEIAKEDGLDKNSYVYQQALEEAMADGIITSDEENMLNRLRLVLDITPERHEEIHRRIKKKKAE